MPRVFSEEILLRTSGALTADISEGIQVGIAEKTPVGTTGGIIERMF